MSNHKELADTIMETEKSHSLHFASWRPRKAGGIFLGTIELMKRVPVQGQKTVPAQGSLLRWLEDAS